MNDRLAKVPALSSPPGRDKRSEAGRSTWSARFGAVARRSATVPRSPRAGCAPCHPYESRIALTRTHEWCVLKWCVPKWCVPKWCVPNVAGRGACAPSAPESPDGPCHPQAANPVERAGKAAHCTPPNPQTVGCAKVRSLQCHEDRGVSMPGRATHVRAVRDAGRLDSSGYRTRQAVYAAGALACPADASASPRVASSRAMARRGTTMDKP